MMNKREFRAAKDYFRKAKGLKPTTPQIVDQIKQIENILPGCRVNMHTAVCKDFVDLLY